MVAYTEQKMFPGSQFVEVHEESWPCVVVSVLPLSLPPPEWSE